MAEKRWRTAAEMQLLNGLLRVEVAGHQLDLLLQALQVGLGAPPVLGDHLVAGAVVANVGAEGYMHVQRQWPHCLSAVTQGVEQVEGADLAVKLYGGGVGRVARPRQVVAVNQICVPTNGVEHAGGPPDWLVGRV
ncbi:hypothetical protein PFLmoz3_02315 [Pseudomonas fluorescens]|uniref:Uncharacterized protein n=1 Tax=Pseudomonas fluorescens TaxID=294 RepID=A0A109LIE7_PSEFL|nr:hypothetical protein PFLmoz3_02315 [Pseudomonas fluorescens]